MNAPKTARCGIRVRMLLFPSNGPLPNGRQQTVAACFGGRSRREVPRPSEPAAALTRSHRCVSDAPERAPRPGRVTSVGRSPGSRVIADRPAFPSRGSLALGAEARNSGVVGRRSALTVAGAATASGALRAILTVFPFHRAARLSRATRNRTLGPTCRAVVGRSR